MGSAHSVEVDPSCSCLRYRSSCDTGDKFNAQPTESAGMCFFGTIESLLGVSLNAAYSIASDNPLVTGNSYCGFLFVHMQKSDAFRCHDAFHNFHSGDIAFVGKATGNSQCHISLLKSTTAKAAREGHSPCCLHAAQARRVSNPGFNNRWHSADQKRILFLFEMQ